METSRVKQKQHADFQDRYRRSSNFRSIVKKESFTVKGDGELEMNSKA